MNIIYKATNTTLTEAVTNAIDAKLKPLTKFLREEDKVRVELEVDKRDRKGQHYRAEIDIQPHGFYAEAKADDFYEALDLLVPKIKEQVLKLKEKKIDKRRKAARVVKGK